MQQSVTVRTFIASELHYNVKMDCQVKTLSCIFLGVMVVCVRSRLASIPLPRSLELCLEDKNRNYRQLTDEEAIGTCMMDFMWMNNKKCNEVSSQTIRWFAQLAVNRTKQNVWSHIRPKERKEYRMLTDEERNDYHRAVNALKQNTGMFPNKYDAFAEYHRGLAGTSAHRGPAFLDGIDISFSCKYEQALQEEVPGVMLPYLDTTLDSEMLDPTDSVIWTDLFLGNGNGSVRNGPFANWNTDVGPLTRAIGQGQLMNKERVSSSLENNYNHASFAPDIEMQHDNVHIWVGGQMAEIEVAPFDPVFYMHHAYIDCVWEKYRERLRGRNINPENDYPAASGGHAADQPMVNLPRFPEKRIANLHDRQLTNKDGHRDFWTREYYRCASFPECSYKRPNCGSKWLECNIFTQRCVSKGSAAALPKVTPEQMMKVMYSCFPDRLPSHMEPLQSPANFPVLTYDLISSGEMFYSYVRQSFGTTSHHVGKRAIFRLSDGTIKEVQTHKVPNFNHRFNHAPTRIVTFPMVPIMYTTESAETSVYPFHHPTSRPISKIQRQQSDSNHSPEPPSIWTIEEFYIPEIEKPCDGYPIQNTFVVDCEAKTKLWVFVPIKVVHIRHGEVPYTTFQVDEHGRYSDQDIYSQGEWIEFFNGRPLEKRPTIEKCRNDKSGLVKVRLTSYGLSYDGTYSDHVFVDNRQPVTTATSFIAIKDPTTTSSRVLFTAVDQCGISCRAYCLVKTRKGRYPNYQECSGAVEIDSRMPYSYGKTYREAAKNVWRNTNSDIVYSDDNEIPVIFYCDYKNQRPAKLFK